MSERVSLDNAQAAQQLLNKYGNLAASGIHLLMARSPFWIHQVDAPFGGDTHSCPASLRGRRRGVRSG